MKVFRLGIPLCLITAALSVTACGVFGALGQKPQDRMANPMKQIKTVAVAPVMATESFAGMDLKRFGVTLASELQHHEGFVVTTPRQVMNFVEKRKKSYQLPAQARELAADMQVDAIIVAVINQFNPYENPRVGISMMMFFAKAWNFSPVDIAALERSGVDLSLSSADIGSVVSVIEVVDASRMETSRKLEIFAGRQADTADRALGANAYRLIMSNYEQFVCYEVVENLLGFIKDELDKAEAERLKKAQRKAQSDRKNRKKPPTYEWR